MSPVKSVLAAACLASVALTAGTAFGAAKAVEAAPPTAAKTPAQEAKSAPAASTPVEALEARLAAAMKSGNPENRVAPDLYAAAKARLVEARALYQDDPEAEATRASLQACSLLTEAAVTQIKAQSLQVEKSRLSEQRARTLTELAMVHDEINTLERSHSSSLKADLDEAKRKAAQARDEAEKKFSELNSALIQVSKDARGTIISMSDILFDVGKATLTTDLKTSLAKIAGILTIYKDANVLVEGHTDNVGGEEYNQKLSEKRASNVMEFMVNAGGIAAARLQSQGHGFSKPIADNATKEGRQKNRRVDLVVMDKKSP
jgi:outer membrane protein OmpA-like peptidoglycan-associated protein